MSDEKENALALPTKELGRVLVHEAAQRYDEARRELIFNDVQRLMQCRDDSLRQAKFYTRSADWYTRKLAAIETGEFTFDKVTGILTFTDPEFARANF